MDGKEMIARRIARMMKDGDFVNLGIGIPFLVTRYLPEGINVMLHAENGIVGVGAASVPDVQDHYTKDPAGAYCSVQNGGAVIDSATSFGLIRGGHLDATVLGGMQVDMEGSLANWTIPNGKLSGMGGAMDLVSGAKKVIIAMEHCTKNGQFKILKKCTYPLTGYKVVNFIVTDMALIEVTPKGLHLKERAPGVTVDDICKKTEAELYFEGTIPEMQI